MNKILNYNAIFSMVQNFSHGCDYFLKVSSLKTCFNNHWFYRAKFNNHWFYQAADFKW